MLSIYSYQLSSSLKAKKKKKKKTETNKQNKKKKKNSTGAKHNRSVGRKIIIIFLRNWKEKSRQVFWGLVGYGKQNIFFMP